MTDPSDAILMAKIEKAIAYYKRLYPLQTVWTDEEIEEVAMYEATLLRQYEDPSSSWFIFYLVQRMRREFKQELAARERRVEATMDDVAAPQKNGIEEVVEVYELTFQKLSVTKRGRHPKADRNREIVERVLFKKETMENVARRFEITRARVHQVVERFRQAFQIEWENRK